MAGLAGHRPNGWVKPQAGDARDAVTQASQAVIFRNQRGKGEMIGSYAVYLKS